MTPEQEAGQKNLSTGLKGPAALHQHRTPAKDVTCNEELCSHREAGGARTLRFPGRSALPIACPQSGTTAVTSSSTRKSRIASRVTSTSVWVG